MLDLALVTQELLDRWRRKRELLLNPYYGDELAVDAGLVEHEDWVWEDL